MANLSQNEIDAMLKGTNGGQPSDMNASGIGRDDAADDQAEDIFKYFSADEIDALGETGNICIGTSATTMSTLVGRKVTITTPKVTLHKAENALSSYKCPFLAVSVEYIQGLLGKNLLVVKDYDAALIADLMMGGDGNIDKDAVELNDIHISAMSEVMNQMIGSAATAMSNMLGNSVNISPPQIIRMEADESIAKYLGGASPVVKISFDMEIEGLLRSDFIQIMSIDVAKELIHSLMNNEDEPQRQSSENTRINTAAAEPQVPDAGKKRPESSDDRDQVKVVRSPQYQSFDDQVEANANQNTRKSNFDLINDIPLQVTVELGKVVKNLNEVVNMGIGSIVVLDKQSGDLVEVIVNGKRIARGEVVVIDENYGVRITEILKT
jgi:flagellar motor switch protein FliN